MSVLIRGIEIPKSCWDCFACHDGWCIINQKIEGHRTVTHSCPLVEVPKHGDLIDRDAYCKQCYEDTHFLCGDDPGCEFCKFKDAPTIIESEGE